MERKPNIPNADDMAFDAYVVRPINLTLFEGEQETYRQAQIRIREAQARMRKKYQRSIPAKKRQ